MQEHEVINILKRDLNFTDQSISKLKSFSKNLITANVKYNFIAKSTEPDIWHRHILDSAQLIKFIDFKKGSLSDLGTGAGFPGIVLAIFNKNKDFHVKLYEKSPIKRDFLNENIKKLQIGAETFSNIYEEELDSDFVVCRAFKKIDKIIQVSREIIKKPHKLIVLKGKRAQEDLNKAFKSQKYHYKIEQSITDEDSKIIIIYFN
jgi:16S rRNA (guanine527-N7)-methyltransferase